MNYNSGVRCTIDALNVVYVCAIYDDAIRHIYSFVYNSMLETVIYLNYI